MEIVKLFQSLIVGVVGFVGVIATLLVNALLARRQHSRQVEHDGKVLRVAIRAELESIRDAFKERLETLNELERQRRDHLETGRPEQGSGVMPPVDEMTDVYDRLLGQLGLLSEHEIRAVMRAYLLIRQMPERIKLLGQNTLTRAERDLGVPNVPGRYFNGVKKMHETYLEEIEKALSVIAV